MASSRPRLNYDDIAHLYDEPERDYDVDPHLVAFLRERTDLDAARVRILDVGCGTGKQLAANRARYPDLTMAGVDKSGGMLRIARNRRREVFWVQGDGRQLPFASDRFDYVTSQFSYQHVQNTPQLLAESFRVLRGRGRFVMTNIDPWSMPRWLVYQYFPAALELDRRDFLPVDRLREMMQDTGFKDIQVRRQDLTRHESLRHFLAYASARHRASQLMAIPDEAYAAGLRRLTGAVAKAPDDDPLAKSEFVLVTLSGNRPDSREDVYGRPAA